MYLLLDALVYQAFCGLHIGMLLVASWNEVALEEIKASQVSAMPPRKTRVKKEIDPLCISCHASCAYGAWRVPQHPLVFPAELGNAFITHAQGRTGRPSRFQSASGAALHKRRNCLWYCRGPHAGNAL